MGKSIVHIKLTSKRFVTLSDILLFNILSISSSECVVTSYLYGTKAFMLHHVLNELTIVHIFCHPRTYFSGIRMEATVLLKCLIPLETSTLQTVYLLVSLTINVLPSTSILLKSDLTFETSIFLRLPSSTPICHERIIVSPCEFE